MTAPIADSETEVRRLKSLIAGFNVRAGRVLPSSGSDPRQEIVELRNYADYVGREVNCPPLPPHLVWMTNSGAGESALSVDSRPH